MNRTSNLYIIRASRERRRDSICEKSMISRQGKIMLFLRIESRFIMGRLELLTPAEVAKQRKGSFKKKQKLGIAYFVRKC